MVIFNPPPLSCHSLPKVQFLQHTHIYLRNISGKNPPPWTSFVQIIWKNMGFMRLLIIAMSLGLDIFWSLYNLLPCCYQIFPPQVLKGMIIPSRTLQGHCMWVEEGLRCRTHSHELSRTISDVQHVSTLLLLTV